MTLEFKPCPFCGKHPKPFTYGHAFSGKADVTCDTEMCPADQILCSAEDWNRRATIEIPFGDLDPAQRLALARGERDE